MSLAFKFYDSVIGEIVNKTKLSSKKLARSNRNSRSNNYLYMTKESGEKIRDFIDLDNKRQEQIMQDAQVLKKAYLSDEVVEKITEEIDKIFEKEYYSYTNRLHEHKNMLEEYRTYLNGIEDRVRDYEKMALQSNTELQNFSVAFDNYNIELDAHAEALRKQTEDYADLVNKHNEDYADTLGKFNDEINSYTDVLNQYENKLKAFQAQSIADKEIIVNVEKMVERNLNLDVKIRSELHNELSRYNSKMQDYLEDEFTKIAARSIKSKRKTEAMFGFLLTSNIITIVGLIALYIFG